MSFFEGLKRLFITEDTQDNIELLDEALKPFAGKQDKIKNEKKLRNRYGEGIEDFSAIANGFALFGKSNVKGYNNFYKKFIDFSYKNEIDKIYEYRAIARFPEVAEVLEDAVNESTQLDMSGDIIKLQIVDGDLSANENVAKNIHREFENLFYKRIELPKKIDNLIFSYFIDGKLYWENIIDVDKPKNGILNIKKLPAETMDFSWNPISGKYNFFVQYLKTAGRLPQSLEDAEKAEDIIGFNPKQITYIDYGIYGPGGKKDVIGYLEKVRQPYNQLKLLETSVIIYRIVRAPERLVFKIDVGQMPRDKGMKFVEKVKQNMQKKLSYDPSTGKMTEQPDVMCIKKDTEIPLLDGRILSLEDLVKEYSKGKENWVYSINRKTLKVEPKKIINAKITRLNEQLIRIYLDDNSFIETTLDHKFILNNGEFIRADNLKPNQKLASLDKKEMKIKTYNVLKIEILKNRDDTGCLEVEENHNFAVKAKNSIDSFIFVKNSILENYFLPITSDGRGSNIETVGGNPSGFSELDDIYFFQRKLYRALKYPLSRIESRNEKQSKDDLFSSASSEIARDETKWGRFLKKHQDKFCDAFLDLFLLHLDFIGYLTQFNITKSKLNITMTVPNDFISRMQQNELSQRIENYDKFDKEEFSKVWRMKRYLGLTDEEILENANSLKRDQELGFTESSDSSSY